MSPDTQAPTAAFPLLANPAGYVACTLNLCETDLGRAYWLDLFRAHMTDMLERAYEDAVDRGIEAEVARTQVTQCRASFGAYLSHVEVEPEAFGRLTVLSLCLARERCLRAADIPDPYRLAKQKENEIAMALLPQVLEEIDSLQGRAKVERIMRGVFAGNLFDLGATKTTELFKGKHVDFHDTLAKLKPRPWFIDGLEPWQDKVLQEEPYHGTVIFVDNAGPDVLLGMIPFTRDLLSRGVGVILTANTSPALNDVLHHELVELVDQIGGFDPVIHGAIESGQLELIASGNGAPLIDLHHVSAELAEAVTRKGVDLCVIQGMGRAIETNFDATFSCDTLKLAMIKDKGVGHVLKADLFDLVLKFEPV